MPGSPNGPAYGSQPKLVVMKVLCKLRWRKIRHPLFSLSAFLHSAFLSPFLLACSFSSLRSQSFWQGVSSSLFPSAMSFLSFICFSFLLSDSPSFSPSLLMLSGFFVCLFVTLPLYPNALLLPPLFLSVTFHFFLRHPSLCSAYLLVFTNADNLICSPLWSLSVGAADGARGVFAVAPLLVEDTHLDLQGDLSPYFYVSTRFSRYSFRSVSGVLLLTRLFC